MFGKYFEGFHLCFSIFDLLSYFLFLYPNPHTYTLSHASSLETLMSVCWALITAVLVNAVLTLRARTAARGKSAVAQAMSSLIATAAKVI